MFKNFQWMIRDYLSHHQLERFRTLVGERVPLGEVSHRPVIGDNLLFFNPVHRQLSKDGYLDHQTPFKLLKDAGITWKRRVWAAGELSVLKPLEIDQEYSCQEKVKFLKKVGSNYYVCLERSILDSKRHMCLRELRTLVYTNSPVSDLVVKRNLPGELIGTFKFSDLDIAIYGQLSLNPHRVHWDRNYCQNVEGYKDVIVQGPFAVQVLIAFALNHFEKPIVNVTYKNVNYIYPEMELEVCVHNCRVYMRDKYFKNKIYVSAVCSF